MAGDTTGRLLFFERTALGAKQFKKAFKPSEASITDITQQVVMGFSRDRTRLLGFYSSNGL